MGRFVNANLPPGKTRYRCTGGWAGPGPVWTGAENLASTGIRSPDRPARSESLYRLSYLGPNQMQYCYETKRSSGALCGRKASCRLNSGHVNCDTVDLWIHELSQVGSNFWFSSWLWFVGNAEPFVSATRHI